jgi:intracellular sulfur oxidation DsrE/DsrF family protein
MKTIKQKEDFFNKISENLDINIMDYFQDDEIKDILDFDELVEILEEHSAFDIEIIYYAKAIQYLKENDASLHESMELASDMGIETKDLNSELLASILASQNIRNDFWDLQNEINEFLEN